MVCFMYKICRNVLCMLLPTRWLRRNKQRGSLKYCVICLTILTLMLVLSQKDDGNAAKVLFLKQSVDVPENLIGNEENKVIKNIQNIQNEQTREMRQLKECSEFPSELLGPMNIDAYITPSFEEVKKNSGSLLKGGCYSPENCKPLQKVAIIIPYKDREAHLKTLLYYLHPMLKRQKAHYCIYVAEQFDTGQFNKAMIMNAAFEEAMKLDWYDCIVFHDVDMIPEDDRNLYKCGKQPRHLSPAIDKFQYKPKYGTDFGGVTGITPTHYRKANGHSNQFWGWGGEDNDMEFRIYYRKMTIIPSELKTGRYKMIVHSHSWKFHQNTEPIYRLNRTQVERAETDGLSDLHYRLVGIQTEPTYTKLLIDIRRLEIKRMILYMDGKPAMEMDVKPGLCRWEKYEGKYLDYSIELSSVKQAAHLQALRISLPPSKSSPPISDNVDAKVPTPTSEKVRFTLVDNFTEAINLCDALYPECMGVQKETNEERYSLRKSNIARNIVISSPGSARILRGKPNVPLRKYFFPKKTCFAKYCPGESQYFQRLKLPLNLDLDKNQTIVQHTYSFDVHFSVLIQPAKRVYYSDIKYFEGQLHKGGNFYSFGWPQGKSPNFSLPDTPREFKFKTSNFVISNVPGCYAMESKIQDKLKQPYYQWNWWFEVTSNDKERDVTAREAFWKRRAIELATHTKTAKLMAEKQKNEALQRKREQEFAKQMLKLHSSDLQIQQKHLNGESSKEKKSIKEENQPDINDLKKTNISPNSKDEGTIEVFNAHATIPPVVQVVPQVNLQIYKQKVRTSFHSKLPSHIQEKINSKDLAKT